MTGCTVYKRISHIWLISPFICPFFFLFSFSFSPNKLCPPNRRGGGHIVFGADPVGVGVGVSVGVGVRVASFPDVIFWTDGRILTKLAQIHCCEGGTSWLDFGDLGPIFKVTATFFNVWNFVSGRYLLNQWTDFDQTCIDTMLGGCEELIRFWWPWPNFQGHSDLL